MLAFAGMATASFMPAGYMPDDDDDVKPKIIIDTTDYVGLQRGRTKSEMAGKCGKTRTFCKQCKGCSVRLAENQTK